MQGIGRLSGAGALWDCVPCVGGGGCAGGGVPLGLGAMPAMSYWLVGVGVGSVGDNSSD